MKVFSLLMAVLCLLTACQKTSLSVQPKLQPVPQVGMDTTDFNNQSVFFGKGFSADLNHDGSKDFYVYTMRVGDVLLQRDYKRFLVGTNQGVDFPVNQREKVPVLSKESVVSQNAFPGYNWYELSAVMTGQKVITADEEWWEGLWVDTFNKYLPFRIHKDGKIYYGWIEMSFDSINERMILHRAAISRQADAPVKIGE